MAVSQPVRVSDDFEVVPNVEATPDSPSNTSQKPVEAMDEKSGRQQNDEEQNGRHGSPYRHFDNSHPLPSSTVQWVARGLLLAQLPFLMAGGVAKVMLQQRRPLMESCDTDEALAIAASQAESVVQRCREDMRWIETEMPAWMEAKMAERRRFPKGGRSRDAHEIPSDKSANKAGKMTQGRCDSHGCSCSRSRRRGSVLRKVFMGLMFLMAVRWIVAVPLAIMSWVIGLRLPLWLVLGAIWMFAPHHRRHRRRGRGGNSDGSGQDGDSDVD